MRRGTASDCCYNCTERHLKCHSTCALYLEFKKDCAEKREAIRKMKEQERIISRDAFYWEKGRVYREG